MKKIFSIDDKLRKFFAGKRANGMPTYIAGIDGLRAIAVLSVLIFHVHPSALPSGFVGVDFFFVISGFVVSLATSSIKAQTLSELLIAFYRRRVVRILPASLIFLVLSAILATLFVPIISPLTSTDLTGLASAFGVANIMLWFTAGDYFSPGTELNLFTHMWSLGVEEQFYLIFPLFAFCIWHIHKQVIRRVAVAGLFLASLLSLVTAIHTTADAQTFAFYMMPARFWELGVGVLLFWIISRQSIQASPGIITLLSVVGGLLLILSLFAIDSGIFPYPGAIGPVLAAAILIYVSASAAHTPAARLLSIWPLRYLGRISYSLYLWHWAVIVLMRWTVGLDSAPLRVTAVLLSWFLADLSYRLIEQPTRSRKFLAGRSDKQIVYLGILAVGASGLLIGGIIFMRPLLSLSVTRQADIWIASTIPVTDACPIKRDKSALGNGGTRYDFYRISSSACSMRNERRIYVIGDSHAWGYQRMLGRVAQETGMPVTVQMAPGCAMLPGYGNDDIALKCKRFLETAFDALPPDLGVGDIVFLPGLRTPRYREYADAEFRPSPPSRIYSDAMLSDQAASFARILDRGARIILEAPKPVYRYAPFRCSDWFNAGNPHCVAPPVTKVEALSLRAPVMQVFERLRALEPRIEVWDPFPILCSNENCLATPEGLPLVSDGDHLSGHANDLLFPHFMRQLR